MNKAEFREYAHPKEASRFILALVFAVPAAALILILTIVSYGTLALIIGFIVFLVWIVFEIFYANFVGNAIHVSDTNYPRLKQLTEEMNEQIGAKKKIDIFVYQQGDFNAYFKRLFARRAIFLNSELLESGVSDDEIRWIIGRFLGMVRSQELTHVFGLLIAGVRRLIVFNLFLLPYERATAYTGDRVALKCIGGDISVAVSAMNKLLVGRGVGYSVNPAGIVEQNRDVRGSFFAFLARLPSPLPHGISRYVDLIGFAGRKFPGQFEVFVAENPSFQSVKFNSAPA
ncbi:MAG: M48 family metallopeptidase [Pseudomonadota bacterium]